MTPEKRFSVACALIVLVVSGSVAVARAQENSGNVVDLNNPVGIEITMSKDNYLIGDTITANELRIRNIEGQSHSVEMKVWFRIPGDVPPISILNVGYDGSFNLPANTDFKLGPLTLLTVTAETAQGRYAFNSRVIDPVTGEFRNEDINQFTVGQVATSAAAVTSPEDSALPLDLRDLVEAYVNPARSGATNSGFEVSTPFSPSIDITLDKPSYKKDEAVNLTVFRLRNQGELSGPIEIKLYWRFPQLNRRGTRLNLGGDGSLVIPANLDVDLTSVLVLVFNIPSDVAAGNTGEVAVRVLHPTTGGTFTIDRESFNIVQ